MVAPTPIMISREKLRQHFADPLPETASMRGCIRSVCMPLCWAGEYDQKVHSLPWTNNEFLEQVPESLRQLFAEYTLTRLTDTSQYESMPADVLRKVLSFTYHAYNENHPHGVEARALLQEAANDLGIPELLAPENFFTSRFRSDQLILPPSGGEPVPLSVAVHSVINQVQIPSAWMQSGDSRAWEGLLKSRKVTARYLGPDEDRNTPTIQYFISWLKDLEICSKDIALVDAYKDKIQLGFSHLYHLYNQATEDGKRSANIVKAHMQHLGIPILPVERLTAEELGWQDEIRARVNRPITNAPVVR